MPDAAVLALDVGTSSARASLFDTDGRPIRGRAARVAYAPTITADGGAEFDPKWLFQQVCTTIDQTLAAPDAPRIVAVGAATFWHSLLGLDSDGEPLTPLYLWLDARSRVQAARLRQELDERDVHARTGCVLHWSYWPAKLDWLRQTAPEQFRRIARWVSFGEYLLARFTGDGLLSTCMASGTGLLDVHRCAWDDAMLRACDVRRDQLGELVPLSRTTAATRATVKRWPALDGAPWVAALGDGACSNVGANCTTPDRFALMIGTSGAERVVFRPATTFEIPWGTWCYRVDEARAVSGGALNDGGALFDWLRHTLRLPSVRRAEAELAQMQPDAHGLTVLPFWGGERSPNWADDARGAIVGLSLHTPPVEVLRACMEAIALRFGDLDRRLLETMPTRNEVIATGGALLRSPAWMQMIADVLGRPVLASAEREASSRGAALLALEAIGELRQPLDAMQPRTRARVEPNPAHTERYRVAAERQRLLYDALVS